MHFPIIITMIVIIDLFIALYHGVSKRFEHTLDAVSGARIFLDKLISKTD